MADLPDNTLNQVKSLVRGAIAKVNVADGDRSTANEAYKVAQQESGSVRETALIEVSEAAATHKWEGDVIEAAVEAVKAEHNTGDKKNTSVNTFASELRNAMRPGVRGKVRQMFATAEAAWDADKDAKTLRRAFVRKYHMVVGHMFKAAQRGESLTTQALNEAGAAILRERELDYTAVHKRLKAIRAQLAAFAKDFPVDGITTCVEFLDEVDVKDLKACVTRAQQKAPAPEPDTDSEPDTDDDTSEPASSSELLDEALRDLSAAA